MDRGDEHLPNRARTTVMMPPGLTPENGARGSLCRRCRFFSPSAPIVLGGDAGISGLVPDADSYAEGFL
jgi:hypothetical protein